MITLQNKITVAAGVITLISALSGAGMFINSEFAHASDIQDIKHQIQMQQITDVQDKIFLHKFKVDSNEATPLDKAMLNRYQNQLNTLNQTLGKFNNGN